LEKGIYAHQCRCSPVFRVSRAACAWCETWSCRDCDSYAVNIAPQLCQKNALTAQEHWPMASQPLLDFSLPPLLQLLLDGLLTLGWGAPSRLPALSHALLWVMSQLHLGYCAPAIKHISKPCVPMGVPAFINFPTFAQCPRSPTLMKLIRLASQPVDV